MLFPVRLIPHRQIEPSFFIYDALVVGECIKADLSVVSAHAAFAETAEAHLCGGKMDDGIVDASSAKPAAGCNLLCRRFVGGEEVKRQRMGHGVDIVDHFVQVVEYQDRHDRTEDLLLHDSVSESHIVHDGWLDAECFTV